MSVLTNDQRIALYIDDNKRDGASHRAYVNLLEYNAKFNYTDPWSDADNSSFINQLREIVDRPDFDNLLKGAKILRNLDNK